jgi:hypothetical protein
MNPPHAYRRCRNIQQIHDYILRKEHTDDVIKFQYHGEHYVFSHIFICSGRGKSSSASGGRTTTGSGVAPSYGAGVTMLTAQAPAHRTASSLLCWWAVLQPTPSGQARGTTHRICKLPLRSPVVLPQPVLKPLWEQADNLRLRSLSGLRLRW